MNRFSTTQLLVFAIEAAISTFNYWSGPLLSAQAPVWSPIAALIAVLVAYRGFLAVRNGWRDKCEREERRDREQHELRTMLERIIKTREANEAKTPVGAAGKGSR